MIEDLRQVWFAILEKTPSFLKNFYFLSLLIFFVWMLVFDRDRIPVQIKKHLVNKELLRETQYYKDKIEVSNKELSGLTNDPDKLIKLAREKYYMHKESEDVYVLDKNKTTH